MTKEIWLNLPVKNIEVSINFFSQLGFRFNEAHSNNESACMILGEKEIVVMLFQEALFKSFIGHDIADTSKGSEVLISLDAGSREEVDELSAKASRAGAFLFARPSEVQGWMYGCGFADPDGHRWNVLYMDKDAGRKQINT